MNALESVHPAVDVGAPNLEVGPSTVSSKTDILGDKPRIILAVAKVTQSFNQNVHALVFAMVRAGQCDSALQSIASLSGDDDPRRCQFSPFVLCLFGPCAYR